MSSENVAILKKKFALQRLLFTILSKAPIYRSFSDYNEALQITMLQETYTNFVLFLKMNLLNKKIILARH